MISSDCSGCSDPPPAPPPPPLLTVRALFGRPMDESPVEYDSAYWGDMTGYAQQKAAVLGYTEETWNEGGVVPPVMTLAWNQLTIEQQRARLYFGWTSTVEGFDESVIIPKGLNRIRRPSGSFVPQHGLVGDNQVFWNALGQIEGRDILFQSVESYETIMRSSKFAPLLEEYYGMNGAAPSSADKPYYDYPTFGEQVIVEGLDSSQICVGDIFESSCEGGLRIQVASPRMPCALVDKKHQSKFGLGGIRYYTQQNALAGWFVRVLREGELRDGDVLHRTSQPNPKWNLKFLCKCMYAEGKALSALSGKVDWKRSIQELEEIVYQLPELAEYEWKERARIALLAMTANAKNKQLLITTSTSSNVVGKSQKMQARIKLYSQILAAAVLLRFDILGALWYLIIQMIQPFLNFVSASR